MRWNVYFQDSQSRASTHNSFSLFRRCGREGLQQADSTTVSRLREFRINDKTAQQVHRPVTFQLHCGRFERQRIAPADSIQSSTAIATLFLDKVSMHASGKTNPKFINAIKNICHTRGIGVFLDASITTLGNQSMTLMAYLHQKEYLPFFFDALKTIDLRDDDVTRLITTFTKPNFLTLEETKHFITSITHMPSSKVQSTLKRFIDTLNLSEAIYMVSALPNQPRYIRMLEPFFKTHMEKVSTLSLDELIYIMDHLGPTAGYRMTKRDDSAYDQFRVAVCTRLNVHKEQFLQLTRKRLISNSQDANFLVKYGRHDFQYDFKAIMGVNYPTWSFQKEKSETTVWETTETPIHTPMRRELRFFSDGSSEWQTTGDRWDVKHTTTSKRVPCEIMVPVSTPSDPFGPYHEYPDFRKKYFEYEKRNIGVHVRHNTEFAETLERHFNACAGSGVMKNQPKRPDGKAWFWQHTY